MAGISRRRTAAELKTFRAEKRKERKGRIEEAAKMRAAGAGYQEIADKLHVSVGTVWTWIALRASVGQAIAEDQQRGRVAS